MATSAPRLPSAVWPRAYASEAGRQPGRVVEGEADVIYGTGIPEPALAAVHDCPRGRALAGLGAIAAY